MKEKVAILSLTLVLLLVSFIIHLLLLKAIKIRFSFLCVVYSLITFYLYAGASYVHDHLSVRGIYFDFGHADELLVEMFLLWIILAFINIIAALIEKKERRTVL